MLIFNVYCFVKILLVDTRPILESTQVLRSKYILLLDWVPAISKWVGEPDYNVTLHWYKEAA